LAAGIATLQQLQVPGFYEALDKKSEMLLNGLKKAAQKAGIPINANRVGSMMGVFFTDKVVNNFLDAKTSDLTLFSAYYNGMLEKGVYLAPSQFEALFVSAAHETAHINATIAAAEEVLQALAR